MALSYEEMRLKLQSLAKLFPDVIQLESSDDKLGIPSLVTCTKKNERCIVDIVTLTDR